MARDSAGPFDRLRPRDVIVVLAELRPMCVPGSTGVDLNAIPLSVIDHVEVLRDGAAAPSEDR